MTTLENIKELSNNELEEINGGYILTSILIGSAIGTVAVIAAGLVFMEGVDAGINAVDKYL